MWSTQNRGRRTNHHFAIAAALCALVGACAKEPPKQVTLAQPAAEAQINEAPKNEAPKNEAPKNEAPNNEAPKPEQAPPAQDATAMNTVPINVEIYHDTICPWCRIGAANLSKALQGWDGPPVQVTYRPFLLNPDAPNEGADLRKQLAAKYGAAKLTYMFARVTEVGRAAGVTFRFDKIKRSPETSLSHALLDWAPAENQKAVIDAIHRAYFEEGKDIGSVDVLLDIAKATQLNVPAARKLLNDPQTRGAIKAKVKATRGSISGVPHFVIDGQHRIQGAQPHERLREALQAAVKRRSVAAPSAG